jgi:hypothetical protein
VVAEDSHQLIAMTANVRVERAARGAPGAPQAR